MRSVYKKTQGPSGIDYRFVRKDNMHLIDANVNGQRNRITLLHLEIMGF
jgi:hypothetical protein